MKALLPLVTTLRVDSSCWANSWAKAAAVESRKVKRVKVAAKTFIMRASYPKRHHASSYDRVILSALVDISECQVRRQARRGVVAVEARV